MEMWFVYLLCLLAACGLFVVGVWWRWRDERGVDGIRVACGFCGRDLRRGEDCTCLVAHGVNGPGADA